MAQPAASTARLPVFLVGYAVSALGSGLIYPIVALYVSEERGLGAAGAGAYFATVALSCFATAPLGGWLADRAGPRSALCAGAAVQAAACLLIAAATSRWSLVAAGLLFGGGSGLSSPALNPMVRSLTDAGQRARAFASCFMAMNIGIGLGAFAGGVTVARLSSLAGYQLVFAADALSYVVYLLLVLVACPRGALPPHAEEDGAQPASSYLTVLRDRRFMRMLAGHTALVLFGYSQLDSAVPVLLHVRFGLGTGVIGGLVLINTVAAACLPRVIDRLTQSAPRMALLRSVGMVWTAAFTVVAMGWLAGAGVRVAVMGLFAVLFAVGECLYACSFPPLVTELSTPGRAGRYAAMASMSWEMGFLVGPALGIAAVASGGVAVYWAIFGGGLLLASLAVAPMRAGGRRNASAGVAPGGITA